MSHIPQFIFSTCSQEQANLESIRRERDRLTLMNPSWSYKEYSDNECHDFIQKNFDSIIVNAFKCINPLYGAAKADFFRYCLIYHFGGIYLDIKSTFTADLSQLVQKNDQFLLSQWDNKPGQQHFRWGIHPQLSEFPGGEYQQWFLAASPHHPFLEKVIQKVTKNILDYPLRPDKPVGKSGVLEITGPIAYTLAINNYIVKNKVPEGGIFRHVESRREGFKYSIFEHSGQTLSHSRHYKSGQYGNQSNRLDIDAAQYSIPHYIHRKDPIILLSN